MSSVSGAAFTQIQTQATLSTVVLKKAHEAEQEFASEISKAAQKAPPPGTGARVDETV